MTDIASVNHSSVEQPVRVAAASQRAAVRRADSASSSARESDQVEVSALARFLSQLRDVPAVRQDLVDEVREQIDDGTYESDARIDGAIEKLLEEEPGLFEDLTAFFEDNASLIE